jgi:hypothetical protein
MNYDFNKIDSRDINNQIYELSVDPHLPALDKFAAEDVHEVVQALQESLPSLPDDRLTFDAETLLGPAWRTGNRSQHNRTFGVILRRLVDLNLVPLERVPKGRGTRIRFRIRFSNGGF